MRIALDESQYEAALPQIKEHWALAMAEEMRAQSGKEWEEESEIPVS